MPSPVSTWPMAARPRSSPANRKSPTSPASTSTTSAAFGRPKSKNYRKWNNSRPEGDRILVLEDTNGDGRADKQTVFYQGRDIDSVHGVCVLGNRVIVSAGDKVQVFTTTTSDLPVRSKETLFSGIGGTQHDHGIHAFCFGPDGKLYFNFGNEGKQIKDKDGKPLDRRCRQRGQQRPQALSGRHGLPLQPRRQPDRNPGLELPQQLGGDGRFVRHALAVGQRRRRQSRASASTT